MNKIKSILALLLLGGLVVTGCEKKNKSPSGDSGTQQSTNDGSSGSGDNGGNGGGGNGGGGNQGGEGGGQQGGGQQGGGQQGGGEGGGQQGGGSQGGGDVQTDHFSNKKLTIESITAQPTDHLAEIQAQYANAYLCLFSEGNVVEMILPAGGEEFSALLGTYAVSQDGLTATITATDSYISTLDMHIPLTTDDLAPFAITFDTTTSKYTMTMPVEQPGWQANATFVCVVSQDAPTHANIPEPAPVAWPGETIASFLQIWGVTNDVVPACGVEGVTSVMVYPETIKENTYGFNIILMGGAEQNSAYVAALTTVGYAETSPNSREYRSTNNEISISVEPYENDLSISVTNNHIKYYVFSNTNDWDVTDANAEFYIWVWDGNGNNRWYSLGEPDKDNDDVFFYLTLKDTWTNGKIVRVNPAAAHKPVEGSTTYGTYTNEEVWNETSDFPMNALMPYVEFSF